MGKKYDAGHSDGFYEGHDKGYYRGFPHGLSMGREQGETSGHAVGYLEGFEAGKAHARKFPVDMEPKAEQDIYALTEAIRLTVEYIGNAWLPPIAGWSWYDALVRYRPELAAEFKRNPILVSTKKEGDRAGQIIFDEIQPGSPMDDLYQALKQEEDS